MPFTATISAPQLTATGSLHVTVNYTDGTHTVNDTLDASDATQFSQTVANRLAQLNALAASIASVKAGVFVPPTPATPPVVVVPPAKQTAFVQAWQTLQRLTPLLNAGVITTADPTYSAALSAAIANYDSSYV